MPVDPQKTLQDLSDAGIVNLDASLRELLAPEGIGAVSTEDAETQRANALAWTDYVLITGGGSANVAPGGAGEVRPVSESVRDSISGSQSPLV